MLEHLPGLLAMTLVIFPFAVVGWVVVFWFALKRRMRRR